MPRANSNSSSCRPQIILQPVHVPQADGTIITYPGKPRVVEPMIGTAEAARLLGLDQRSVARMCEQGLFTSAFKPAGGELSRWRLSRAEVLARLPEPSD